MSDIIDHRGNLWTRVRSNGDDYDHYKLVECPQLAQQPFQPPLVLTIDGRVWNLDSSSYISPDQLYSIKSMVRKDGPRLDYIAAREDGDTYKIRVTSDCSCEKMTLKNTRLVECVDNNVHLTLIDGDWSYITAHRANPIINSDVIDNDDIIEVGMGTIVTSKFFNIFNLHSTTRPRFRQIPLPQGYRYHLLIPTYAGPRIPSGYDILIICQGPRFHRLIVEGSECTLKSIRDPILASLIEIVDIVGIVSIDDHQGLMLGNGLIVTNEGNGTFGSVNINPELFRGSMFGMKAAKSS